MGENESFEKSSFSIDSDSESLEIVLLEEEEEGILDFWDFFSNTQYIFLPVLN